MSEEELGFVIKDRRSLDEKGELKDKEPEKETPAREAPSKEKQESIPLPEASFTSLIFSLSSSAFLNLGEIPDPGTGEKNKDLPLAKHAIDTIAMLKEKTAGNLSDEEKRFLETVLTDLRLRYVKATE
jgi:hypothetical protein